MKVKRVLLVTFLIYTGISIIFEARAEVKNIKVGGPLIIKGFTRTSPEKIQEIEKKIDLAKSNAISEIVLDIFPEKNEILWILKDIVNSEDQLLERRITAARVLGELRLDYDVHMLVNNLLLGHERVENYEELNKLNFPVGFALINIGRPARLHLINKIKVTQDDEIIRLCAFVLMKIEDKDVARFILEREIKKETVTSQREKLGKALSCLN